MRRFFEIYIDNLSEWWYANYADMMSEHGGGFECAKV